MLAAAGEVPAGRDHRAVYARPAQVLRTSESFDVTEANPELAVVVLSVGAPAELATAVRSLKRQSVPLEIVIVNSGGGDPLSVVPDTDVKIVSVPEVLWPGAARNMGIRATRAPWIAFMASDTIATENWAPGRLQLHRSGHRAVACAVINSHPRNLCAWAYHINLFVRRLPGIPAGEAIRYGLSYSRSLFDEHGYFREDLRIGEDTDFNARLSLSDHPVWAPEVQTAHLNPTGFRRMVQDQYARGRRSGLYWPQWYKAALLQRICRRLKVIVRLSSRSVQGLDRCFVIASWPLLFACVCAYEFGVAAGLRQDQAGEVEEIDNGWLDPDQWYH